MISKSKKRRLRRQTLEKIFSNETSPSTNSTQSLNATPSISPHLTIQDAVPKQLKKYFFQRYSLFSKYDLGIKIDYEGWYSVTPEKVADYLAMRCQSETVLDAFAGVGGNTIAFSKTCENVIAIELDSTRYEYLEHNCKLYDRSNISFFHGDFFDVVPTLFADVIFLSPPWGGPAYMSKAVMDLQDLPICGLKIFKAASQITRNICYFLPCNINTKQLIQLSPTVEIQTVYLNQKIKAIVAYFGSLSRNKI